MSVIESLKEKTGSVINSASGLGKVGVDAIEKSTQGALDSYSYYSSLGIKQLRLLTAAGDLGAVRGLVSESVSLNGKIMKRVIDDLQKTLAIGTEVRSSISEIFGRAVKETAPRATAKTAKGSAT